jgi:hypothetical protein
MIPSSYLLLTDYVGNSGEVKKAPYHAYIEVDYTYICAGAVVDLQYVISTASCLDQ